MRLDTNATSPFELGSGEDACLLIHGFTGTPWEMRPLGEALADAGYFAKGIRLPGHGLSPEAMEHVTHLDWLDAAEAGLASLKDHRHVFVAGLSMGALLAALLAARHPSRVRALALLAPALKFRRQTERSLRLFRVLPLMDLWRPTVHKDGVDLSDPGQRQQAPLLPHYPSTRLHDLLEVRDRARAALPHVRCPTWVGVSEQDHVVDPSAGRCAVRRLKGAPEVRFIQLKEGYHLLPRDISGPLVAEEVKTFFARHGQSLATRRLEGPEAFSTRH